MISSTVAVEELNAFILSGNSSFTGLVPDAFVRSASTLLGDAIVQVGYIIVVLSSNCLFWRSICNFHRLLNLTTEVDSYLGRCKRLFSTHEFFTVCNNMSFHSVSTLSVLQSQVFDLICSD